MNDLPPNVLHHIAQFVVGSRDVKNARLVSKTFLLGTQNNPTSLCLHNANLLQLSQTHSTRFDCIQQLRLQPLRRGAAPTRDPRDLSHASRLPDQGGAASTQDPRDLSHASILSDHLVSMGRGDDTRLPVYFLYFLARLSCLESVVWNLRWDPLSSEEWEAVLQALPRQLLELDVCLEDVRSEEMRHQALALSMALIDALPSLPALWRLNLWYYAGDVDLLLDNLLQLPCLGHLGLLSMHHAFGLNDSHMVEIAMMFQLSHLGPPPPPPSSPGNAPPTPSPPTPAGLLSMHHALGLNDGHMVKIAMMNQLSHLGLLSMHHALGLNDGHMGKIAIMNQLSHLRVDRLDMRDPDICYPTLLSLDVGFDIRSYQRMGLLFPCVHSLEIRWTWEQCIRKLAGWHSLTALTLINMDSSVADVVLLRTLQNLRSLRLISGRGLLLLCQVIEAASSIPGLEELAIHHWHYNVTPSSTPQRETSRASLPLWGGLPDDVVPEELHRMPEVESGETRAQASPSLSLSKMLNLKVLDLKDCPLDLLIRLMAPNKALSDSAKLSPHAPSPDSASPSLQAASSPPDATLPLPDTALPSPGTTLPSPDTTLHSPDAILPSPDTTLPSRDASLTTIESLMISPWVSELRLGQLHYLSGQTVVKLVQKNFPNLQRLELSLCGTDWDLEESDEKLNDVVTRMRKEVKVHEPISDENRNEVRSTHLVGAHDEGEGLRQGFAIRDWEEFAKTRHLLELPTLRYRQTRAVSGVVAAFCQLLWERK
eukprot:gene18246-24699_t